MWLVKKRYIKFIPNLLNRLARDKVEEEPTQHGGEEYPYQTLNMLFQNLPRQVHIDHRVQLVVLEHLFQCLQAELVISEGVVRIH